MWWLAQEHLNILQKKQNRLRLKDPSMEESMPKVFRELAKVFLKLERHYKDMQDIEFTAENNKSDASNKIRKKNC